MKKKFILIACSFLLVAGMGISINAGSISIEEKEQLALKLYDIGAVKFGDFALTKGLHSPVYFDLRVIISYPHVLETVARFIWEQIEYKNVDLICGVPTAGVPIATAITMLFKTPMIVQRKQAKKGGSGQMIEGFFKFEDTCCLIDDLVTSGSSIIESIKLLGEAGLLVSEVAVLIDRGQGGRELIEKSGCKFHTVFELSEFLSILESAERITKDDHLKIIEFITNN